ncbi:MAG: quinone oxidoreductase, partial [Chloroflexota bacterium]
MKAIRYHQPGGPEVLRYEDVPEPVPGPGQVLIEVLAAGVNYSDVRRRLTDSLAVLPAIPGNEASGTVVALGEGVSEFRVGDVVVYGNVAGASAQRSVVPAAQLVKLPAGLDPKLAAAAFVQGLTAHTMGFGAYHLKNGETVLVHAGAGGVGGLLTQMAKQAGSTVIATVGSDAKIEAARAAGAEVVINYNTHDFEAEVKRATGGKGVNAVFDSVGKTTFVKGLNCLGHLGTMVLFGQASGQAEPIDVALLHRGGQYITRTGMNHFITTRADLLSRSYEVLSWAAGG